MKTRARSRRTSAPALVACSLLPLLRAGKARERVNYLERGFELLGRLPPGPLGVGGVAAKEVLAEVLQPLGRLQGPPRRPRRRRRRRQKRPLFRPHFRAAPSPPPFLGNLPRQPVAPREKGVGPRHPRQHRGAEHGKAGG